MASESGQAKKVLQSIEEVPVRSSFPLQWRIMCAMQSIGSNFVYNKDYTINRTVFGYLDPTAKASSKPVGGISSKDVPYGEHPDQYVRIFTPSLSPSKSGSKNLPVIILFHGGGFCLYSSASKPFDTLCRVIAEQANAVVVSVSYRLAPEFKCPTAYDDCFQAIRWVQEQLKCSQNGDGELSSSADASRVFFMGDSAGGNISHFMMVRAVQTDLSPLQLKGVVELYPFFGGVERTPSELKMPDAMFLSQKRTDWFWAAYLPAGSDRDNQYCNVSGPSGEDISGLSLPPILVLMGSNDILQDWQARYVKKLREMGKEVQTRCSNVCHAEYILPDVMAKMVQDVVEFINSLLV